MAMAMKKVIVAAVFAAMVCLAAAQGGANAAADTAALLERVHELELDALQSGRVLDDAVVRVVSTVRTMQKDGVLQEQDTLLKEASGLVDTFTKTCAAWAHCAQPAAQASMMMMNRFEDRRHYGPMMEKQCLSSNWDQVEQPCIDAVFALSRFVHKHRTDLRQAAAKVSMRPHQATLRTCQPDVQALCGMDVSPLMDDDVVVATNEPNGADADGKPAIVDAPAPAQAAEAEADGDDDQGARRLRQHKSKGNRRAGKRHRGGKHGKHGKHGKMHGKMHGGDSKTTGVHVVIDDAKPSRTGFSGIMHRMRRFLHSHHGHHGHRRSGHGPSRGSRHGDRHHRGGRHHDRRPSFHGADMASVAMCLRGTWHDVSPMCREAVQKEQRAGSLETPQYELMMDGDDDDGDDHHGCPFWEGHHHPHGMILFPIGLAAVALFCCCRRRRRRCKRRDGETRRGCCCRRRRYNHLAAADGAAANYPGATAVPAQRAMVIGQPVSLVASAPAADDADAADGVTYVPTAAGNQTQRLSPL